MEEKELRPLMVVEKERVRKDIVKALKEVYAYIKGRFDGECAQPGTYSCKEEYALFDRLRIFSPARALELDIITSDGIKAMVAEMGHDDMRALEAGMIREIADYKAMAAGFTADPHKMDEFTEKVLRFWRGKREKLPNFRAAARIAFALKPNSASCERVFSLLKQFFGEQEDDSLADLIQAILMLNYNNRSPG